MWVDGWRSGFKSPSETDRLLRDARAGNFNALFIQVRKRADAYYRSAYEPMAADISPIGYDPLADPIEKAHECEQPIEIHAWINDQQHRRCHLVPKCAGISWHSWRNPHILDFG